MELKFDVHRSSFKGFNTHTKHETYQGDTSKYLVYMVAYVW